LNHLVRVTHLDYTSRFKTPKFIQSMKTLSEFGPHSIQILFTDIDDTLTDQGQLRPQAFEALWRLKNHGLKIIPVTGRPAGWCEMIARFWPVDGIIGENGAFYFRYANKTMKRFFVNDPIKREVFRKTLDQQVAPEILREVPGSAIASDQFCRLSDLAIDYCEDVEPLSPQSVRKIVSIFERHGAHAKVSSIHVNGWFGSFDKLSTCKVFLKNEFNVTAENSQSELAFVGDSPNDEPMFQFFQNSFAVANIKSFLDQLKHKPAYVTSGTGGFGFTELADRLLE
jgi:HAD superfamily hydrolase (TIGR01484 family)